MIDLIDSLENVFDSGREFYSFLAKERGHFYAIAALRPTILLTIGGLGLLASTFMQRNDGRPIRDAVNNSPRLTRKIQVVHDLPWRMYAAEKGKSGGSEMWNEYQKLFDELNPNWRSLRSGSSQEITAPDIDGNGEIGY